MDFSAPISALNAFSVGMQVSANNVANINTDTFQASRAQFAEAEGSRGVTVAAIQKDTSSGGLTQSLRPVENPDTGSIDTVYQSVQSSNTDFAREAVNMITYQRGFEANAAVIRTQDQMFGTVLDLMV